MAYPMWYSKERTYIMEKFKKICGHHILLSRIKITCPLRILWYSNARSLHDVWLINCRATHSLLRMSILIEIYRNYKVLSVCIFHAKANDHSLLYLFRKPQESWPVIQRILEGTFTIYAQICVCGKGGANIWGFSKIFNTKLSIFELEKCSFFKQVRISPEIDC